MAEPYEWLRDRLREAAAEREPLHVGRYQVMEVLGRGGMGKVVRAVDTSLGRIVALKIPTVEAFGRWEREARAMARLSHPAIAAVYDVGAADGLHYIAMEYVDGVHLGDAWREWPIRRRVEALRQVCAAVSFAHDHGVLHRDLKPANVMISGDRVKLIDFGLARLEGDPAMTREGTPLGSPLYMAPEQVRGHAARKETDVYALGVLLYEALAGAPPFTSDTLALLYQAILTEKPVAPSKRAAGVPRDLETLALRAIEKEPAQRPSSAQAFGDDLQRWLDGVPMTIRPIRGAIRFGRAIVRNPRAWTAALVLLLVAGALAWRSRHDRTWTADLLASQAAAAFSAGDVASARRHVDEALRLSPGHRSASYWLARLKLREYHARRGVPSPLISRGAVGVSPTLPETAALRTLRGEIEEALRRAGGDPFAEGALALVGGRFLQALESLRLAADTDESRWLRAYCLYNLGRFGQAREALGTTTSRPGLPLLGQILLALAMQADDPLPLLRDAENAATALMVAGDAEGGRLLAARTQIEGSVLELSRGGDPEERLTRAMEALSGLEGPEACLARGDALLTRAESLAARGRIGVGDPAEYGEAIENYTRALEVRDDFALAHLRRAAARRALAGYRSHFGADDVAWRTLARDDYAAAAVSGHPEARLGLASITAEIERARAATPDVAINATVHELETVTAVVDAAPQNLSALVCRAAVRSRLAQLRKSHGESPVDDLDAGQADCGGALALAPDYVEALVARADLHRLMAFEHRDRDAAEQSFSLARTDLDRALSRNPWRIESRGALLMLLRDRGHFLRERGEDPLPAWREAVVIATDGLNLRPNQANLLYMRAMARRDLGAALAAVTEFQAAIADLDRCIEVNPKQVDAYRVRATLHQRLGLIRAAAGGDPTDYFRRGLGDIAKGFDLDPSLQDRFAHFHFARGSLLLALGEWQEERLPKEAAATYQAAVDAMLPALKINPRYADYYRIRGQALAGVARLRLRAGQDAANEFKRALEDYDFILKEFAHYPLAKSWKEERNRIEAALPK